MSSNKHLERWDGWLDNIRDSISGLLVERHIYKEVQAIVLANPRIHVGSSFYDWMAKSHTSSILSGVRRQIDTDKDVISLCRLLYEIAESPASITRADFLAKRPHATPAELSEEFDTLAGQGASHIDPALVRSHLDCLKCKSHTVVRVAHRRIAHQSTRALCRIPTFEDLDECLSALENTFQKYYSLLRATALLQLLPQWLYDWTAIFREPWIRELEETGK